MNKNTATTEREPSLVQKIKGAGEIVHGIGDNIRGRIMDTVDVGVQPGRQTGETQKGRLEVERGFARVKGQPLPGSNGLSGEYSAASCAGGGGPYRSGDQPGANEQYYGTPPGAGAPTDVNPPHSMRQDADYRGTAPPPQCNPYDGNPSANVASGATGTWKGDQGVRGNQTFQSGYEGVQGEMPAESGNAYPAPDRSQVAHETGALPSRSQV